MKRLLILGVFVLAAVGQDVQHAPTVAQCQADQRLWLAKLESSPPDSTLPAYNVLTRWETEMKDCQDVDPSNHLKYYTTQEEGSEAQGFRMINFLIRHGLWDKFIAEDAAGKR
jgi:hypothetical protein